MFDRGLAAEEQRRKYATRLEVGKSIVESPEHVFRDPHGQPSCSDNPGKWFWRHKMVLMGSVLMLILTVLAVWFIWAGTVLVVPPLLVSNDTQPMDCAHWNVSCTGGETAMFPLGVCVDDEPYTCLCHSRRAELILRSCPTGWCPACSDIDECTDDDACPPTLLCTNTIGNYSCL